MATISIVIYWLSGAYIFFFYLLKLFDWWGFWGVIGGIIVAPGALLFPFLFWFMEGYFPWMIFSVWAVGMLAMYAAGFALIDDEADNQTTGHKVIKWIVWTIIILITINTIFSFLFIKSCVAIDKNTSECSYTILRWLPDEREVFDGSLNTVTTYNKDTNEIIGVRTLQVIN
jgi:hypothetical protein